MEKAVWFKGTQPAIVWRQFREISWVFFFLEGGGGHKFALFLNTLLKCE